MLQKNAITVYSEYSYSGIVPKERALGLFIFERRTQLAELIMRRHLPTHILFNATHVESNAQNVLMTLNFSFWL